MLHKKNPTDASISFDSRAIANAILKTAESSGRSLTMMQVIKLVYLAHGWWMVASGGNPLVSDKAEAWRYGPVNPNVYKAFRLLGSRPIPLGFRAKDPSTGFEFKANLTDDQQKIVDDVVEAYGDLHAYTLSEITHQEGTPWTEIINQKDGIYAKIPDELIYSHFNELYRQRKTQKT